MEKQEYTITKKDFIGFWREGGGEKFFFEKPTSRLIIDLIEENICKNSNSFNSTFDNLLIPFITYTLNDLGLSDERIKMYICDLMWLVLLVIANMYEDKYVDIPEIKWVFDTPHHPFEQYLAAKIPDAYEKYRTAERTLADYL